MSEQVDFLKDNTCINKEFLEKILQEKYDTNSIVLKNFSCDPGVAKGANCGSQITRVKLYYSFSSNENMDFVCSTFVIKTVMQENSAFLKEIIFYQDVLPELHHILDEKIKGTILAPRENYTNGFFRRCFATQNQLSFMIFEDLIKKGYNKVDKKLGLNYDHLSICLSKLAKLHATTACYGYNDPPHLSIYKKPLLTYNTPEFFTFFEKPIKFCADMSKSWPGFEKISEKLHKLQTIIIDKAVNMFKRSKFNVIIHGDLWADNLMYLYDKDENPVDVIMVDYSSGYWGSPSIDIAYLFYSSSSDDIGDAEWCRLIDHYYQELRNNLSVLGYSGYIPTLDDINEELNANSAPIIAITALLNGTRFYDSTAKANVQLMFEDSNFMTDLMSTATFRKRMEFLLAYYDSKGFLD